MTANRRYLVIGIAALAALAIVLSVALWPRSSSSAGAVSTPSPSVGHLRATASPTTPVPSGVATVPGAPPAGSTDQAMSDVVASVVAIESDQQHTAPVAPGVPAAAVPGVQIAVDSAEIVDGEAHGPGEVAGPAFLIAVSVANGTGAPVSLDGVVVNVYGPDGAAGSVLASDPRGSPLQGDLAPGAKASGTYVLRRPGDPAASYVVSVSLGAGTQTVLVTLPPKAG